MSGKPLNALLISNLYPTVQTPGGGVFVTHRVRALRNLGVDVDLVALRLRPPAYIPRSAPSPALAPFSEVSVRASLLDAVRIRRGQRAWGAIGSAVQALQGRAEGADVVVGHGAYGLPAAAVAAQVAPLVGARSVGVFHGSDVNAILSADRRRAVKLWESLDEVMFVSRALQQTAHRLGYRGPSEVIPNGVDLTTFTGEAKSDPLFDVIPRDVPVIAFAGNLLPVKGADRLPAVVRELVATGQEFHLAVMGDGPLEDQVRAQTVGLPVSLLGRGNQEQVAALMARAEVLLLPSRSEGWPCVVLEAFASGATVVGTDVGGVGEAVGSGGSVVPEGPDLERRVAQTVVRELTAVRERKEQRQRAAEFAWEELARREVSIWRRS